MCSMSVFTTQDLVRPLWPELTMLAFYELKIVWLGEILWKNCIAYWTRCDLDIWHSDLHNLISPSCHQILCCTPAKSCTATDGTTYGPMHGWEKNTSKQQNTVPPTVTVNRKQYVGGSIKKPKRCSEKTHRAKYRTLLTCGAPADKADKVERGLLGGERRGRHGMRLWMTGGVMAGERKAWWHLHHEVRRVVSRVMHS